MFGRKKHDDSQPDESKPVAVDGTLSELGWKPLTRHIVDTVEVVKVLDMLPQPMRQEMLNISAQDAKTETDEKMRNAAEFFTAYLSGDIDGAEEVAARGVLSFKDDSVSFGGGKVGLSKIGGDHAKELMEFIDESETESEEQARKRFREAKESEAGQNFQEAYSQFAEATGVEVKLVQLNAASEGDDRFKLVVEIPEKAAFMLHHGMAASTAAASERWRLGILKPGITADHIVESGVRLGAPVDGLRGAVMAVNLLTGKMAMKGAEFSADGQADDESIEVTVETVDAVWKNALDEANAPVETPHDMAKYIKWLQNEKQRLETELATANGGGGEETS